MSHAESRELPFIGVKVLPSLRKALERASADRKVTMTHVVITALASHLRRAGYFRPAPNSRTAKRNKRLRLAHIINAKKGKSRKRFDGHQRTNARRRAIPLVGLDIGVFPTSII